MMDGNSEWTGSYTALFYSTPALRVFYTKVFLYWRHAWQWLYGAAEQWQWHECENTYGGFLWLDLHQNMKYFGGKGSNSSEFKPGESEWRSTEAVLVTPYCEALRWFFHYRLSHLSCLVLIVKEYIGLLTVVWNIFFDLVFFRSDCVTLMFPFQTLLSAEDTLPQQNHNTLPKMVTISTVFQSPCGYLWVNSLLTLSAVALAKMVSVTVSQYSFPHSFPGADLTAMARAKLRPWRTIQSTPDTSAKERQTVHELVASLLG